jgi:hypothetical protein
MSAGTIVGLAGVPCKFAIAKPEFDPKDTRASGEPPPPTGQPLLKNLTYEQEPNNATNNWINWLTGGNLHNHGICPPGH